MRWQTYQFDMRQREAYRKVFKSSASKSWYHFYLKLLFTTYSSLKSAVCVMQFLLHIPTCKTKLLKGFELNPKPIVEICDIFNNPLSTQEELDRAGIEPLLLFKVNITDFLLLLILKLNTKI